MTPSMNSVTERRLRLLANHYLPIPVSSPDAGDPHCGKSPVLKGWAKVTGLQPKDIEGWAFRFPDAGNTGVLCGHIVGIDVDVDDEELVHAFIEEAAEIVGVDAPIRIGRAPRALMVFRTETPFKKICSREFILRSGLIAKVEVLGQGQQFVADGVHPGTMKPYSWRGPSLFEMPSDELPVIDEETVRRLLQRFDRLALEHGAELRETTLCNEADGKRSANYGSGPVPLDVVAEALAHVPNDDVDYDFWLRIGFSLHSGLGEDGFDLWDDWSKQSRKYDQAFTWRTWSYFKKDGGVTIGTLFHLASRNGWRNWKSSEARPEILVLNGALHEAVDKAEEALLSSRIEVFERGGMLVRPVRAVVPGAPADSAETVKLVRVGEDWLSETFSRIATFQKVKGDTGEVTTINCPTTVVKAYLARVGEWRVPKLSAVVHVPTLREDGTVIDRPGYDSISGLYAAFDPEIFPPIPEKPDRHAALEALAKLEGVVKTFPFVSPADRSVAVATILTGLCRHRFPTAPIFGYSAPAAGAGKSLLVDLCSLIVSGHPAAVLSPGRSEEELEKRLTSAFIESASLVTLDNCNEALGGAFLCQVLTQSRVRNRILGQSTIVELPTNCLMLATGNNLTFADDMTRRALLCTLDPKVERPEERQFEGDIVQEVRRRRGELVAAGLTILRAFVVAGQPSTVRLLGSFSEWSRFIRGVLVWLDRADPADTIEKVRANDPVLSRNLALLHEIDLEFGPSAFTTAELMEEALFRSNNGFGAYDYRNKELHLVLSEFSGGRDSLNAVSIGKALGRLEGRLCGGMTLKKLKGPGGKCQWQLVGGVERGRSNVI